MEQKQTNIDHLFKSELGSYAETPPPMAWDALEKKLDKIPPKGSVFTPHGAIYTVMVCSVLLLGISVAKKLSSSSAQNDANKITGVINIANSAVAGNQNEKTASLTPASNSQPAKQTGETATPNVPQLNNVSVDSKENNTGKTGKENKIAAGKKSPTHSNWKNNTYGASGASAKLPGGTEEQGIEGDKTPKAYNSTGLPLTPAGVIPDNSAATPPTPQDNGKKKDPIPAKNPVAQTPDKPKPNQKHYFPRFEVGIKAGYESGFDNDAAKKMVVSPYIQYNLSPKFGIMLQPSVKSGTIQSRVIGKSESYYKQNNDSGATPVGHLDPNPVFDLQGINYYMYHYYYSQTHDSIIKSHSMGGSYTEYETPVLAKYNLGHGMSVYGGVNVVYSRLITVKEQTNTISGILKTDSSLIAIVQKGAPAPPAQYSTSQVITYTGNSIGEYKNPYPTPAGNSVRIGYMVGFSYAYNNRWLLDGLVQQTPTASNLQGGYNINSALSSAYFRFTLGYKLIK